MLLTFSLLDLLFVAGSKLWTFMDNLDHDFVDATGKTVPPGLAAQRIFGPSVNCGRFARLFVSTVPVTPYLILQHNGNGQIHCAHPTPSPNSLLQHCSS